LAVLTIRVCVWPERSLITFLGQKAISVATSARHAIFQARTFIIAPVTDQSVFAILLIEVHAFNAFVGFIFTEPFHRTEMAIRIFGASRGAGTVGIARVVLSVGRERKNNATEGPANQHKDKKRQVFQYDTPFLLFIADTFSVTYRWIFCK